MAKDEIDIDAIDVMDEDLNFHNKKGETTGVANGVGGWANKGINYGKYLRQLVRNAESSIQNQKHQGNIIHPMKVLRDAYLNTKCQGSSTTCISTLTCDILGNDDKSDDPSVAQEIKVPLKTGDVKVMASDGLCDNIHDDELEKLLRDGLVDLREMGTFSKMLAWKLPNMHSRIQKENGFVHLLLKSAPKLENIVLVASPIVSYIEGPSLKLPSLPLSFESEWPLKVSFNGCRHHQNKWKKWVKTMESLHHSSLERLLALQPEQTRNYNMISGVRIGQWHNVKQSGPINVMTINSSGETFQWRPYALVVEDWIILKVSELVGLDYQELHRQNRVAMQFGYDQYLPKWITCLPSSPGLAWYNYSRPIDSDLRLYYPSGLSEYDRSKKRLKRLFNIYGSPSMLKQVKLETDWDVCNVLLGLPIECQLKKVKNYPDVPPGFPPKCCGENDKKNLSMEHIAEERVYTSTDYAHDNNESSSVVPPMCNGENDKENLSMVVCQTVACDIVAPGLTEKHNVGESVHTSTDVHDSNESSSVVPPSAMGKMTRRIYLWWFFK
ncbi:hypothetical protein HAX54_009087 [Datura stramonium]|uniref:Protein phosphatase n=1 Tax=Datura stramonium TaxID=4076 RepID=A0ABS8RXQ1_DATST|nr:hypothetical protein [Datura stramonium]